jgi:hypothetical protein
MNTTNKEIPTFYPKLEYSESFGQDVFFCPVSKANTYEWDGENDIYPDELKYYFINLVGEPTYIHPDFENLYEVFCESDELVDEFESFEDFLISKLPNNNFYRLVVVDPDGTEGDFAIFIYEGVYSDK